MIETILVLIFIVVGIVAHIAYKNKWKMVDYF